MTKDLFNTLYKKFLEEVVKVHPVNDAIQNRVFFLFYYLSADELKKVLNEFYKLIAAGKLKAGLEPNSIEWENVVLSLNLDKAYKKGVRHRRISESEHCEVASLARKMQKILTSGNSDDIEEVLKNI